MIVCDLHLDPQGLLDLDAETLRQRLYTRREDLAEGELPVPLKLIHINRCPVVAPLNVLRGEDQQRLNLDLQEYQRRAVRLSEAREVWQDKLSLIYGPDEFAASEDPEQQLYDGFIGDRDRRLCEQVRQADPQHLALQQWPFDDERLPELLFRYRARNFTETLSKDEQERWRGFCQQRLLDPQLGAPNTLESFRQGLEQSLLSADSAQRQVLEQWQEYVRALALRLAL